MNGRCVLYPIICTILPSISPRRLGSTARNWFSIARMYGWQYCTVALRLGALLLFGPPPCHVVPRKYTALPAGQVMGRAWSGVGCSAPQRWDFGTRRVAPFSCGGG